MKPRLVVLTGAGISAESGLRTFRDTDGLWEGYDVYEVASPQGWQKNPQLVLDFYNMRRRDVTAAMPNAAHIGLAALQEKFDVEIITQNIDDLHERAGSKKVLHLHGEIFKMRSILDERRNYEITGDINWGDMAVDGGQLRPDIVWFGEAVPKIEDAAAIVMSADVFAVIGTSLVVYPAAGLVNFLQDGVPAFVIDKKLPHMEYRNNLVKIEKPATEGIVDMIEALEKIV
ncbi:Sir2 family NAD-dependent protein deacetylase [Chitinophaga rhizophila]|uniref:protein acetyllysine N-acetyltransferase n=1 Tax=Chitinophaga rhizophila TaxID=2866212 RepID=A0ABS7GJT7_9BACT|nr:Sir2 family NAD-dependent protein deacetylase [Chitinophaga rhizophila]MBW8687651.1 NAD-dependent deacylase [Chitinophaga rhizophila]